MIWTTCLEKRGPAALIAAVVFGISSFVTAWSFAADAAFVGVLAIAIEDDGAKQLGLSDDVRKKLTDLVDRRETEALEIALQIKDLPAAERTAKLAPFVAESERLGFALLTPAQQARLKQMRVQRAGMSSLADDALAKQLELSDDQRQQIAKLLQQRTAEINRGTEQERRTAREKFERDLAGVLTKSQRGVWEQLAGQVETTPAAQTVAEKLDAGANTPASESKSPAGPPSPFGRGPRSFGSSGRSGGESSNGSKTSSAPAGSDPAKLPVADAEGKLKFAFRYAPWKDVLDWFAQQANLSLVLDAPPPGTFNYTDTRSYTPAEAIDLLNSVLLTKGYTLIRRERMLMVFNLEDEIPEPLIELLQPTDLDGRGKYELVKCLFPLKKMTPEDAEKELNKLIGPAGKVSVLPQAKQILVRETVGKLRAIRDVIDAVENPEAKKEEKLTVLRLEHMLPDEFLAATRLLLGLPEGLNSAPDGSLRISVDAAGGRLLVAGRADRIARVEELKKLLDVDSGRELPTGPVESPQLEIYSVSASDPAAVLQVMQTLLSGLPDVRLATDPKTGNLIAMARPSQHATIRETLKQMQKDGSEVEVVTLRRIDPQTAVVAINKLFGGEEKGSSVTAPKIESDSATRQLFIRGTATQVQQIRSLLEKMGEGDAALVAAEAEQGNVRILPLTGRTARSVLEQVEQLWPTMRKNKIRIVTPATSNLPGIRGQGVAPAAERFDDGKSREEKSPPVETPAKEPSGAPTQKNSAQHKTPARLPVQFAAFAPPDAPKPDDNKSSPPAANPESGAEIVVTIGPAGIVIASADTEALDQFEKLLRALADRASLGGKDYTVFYLKFAKADAAAALLQEVLSGGADAGGGGGGGSLLGDLASGMLGDMGGGLLGGLLGGGGGGGAKTIGSTSISIVPDARLNALIVNASPTDLDMVEQLLKVIDQESGPEDVQTAGKPRFIPVFNTSAEEIATVLRQVYSSRITGGTTQQQQPSPEEFIRALRGGGRGKDSRADAKMEPAKMTLGVDAKSNSLIVTAPDPLYQEVKSFVEQMDLAAENNRDEAMRVVTVKKANPELIQRAVAAMAGPQVRATSVGGRPGGAGTGGPGFGGPPPQAGSANDNASGFQGSPDQVRDQLRQRMELFNNLQRQGGGGDPRGGGGGGRGRGGPGGGR